MQVVNEAFMHIIKREQRILAFSMVEVVTAAEEIEDAEDEIDDDGDGDEYVWYSGTSSIVLLCPSMEKMGMLIS